MRERVTILTLTARADGTGWEWVPNKTTWAKAEKTGKLSLFSTIGAGQEGYTFTLRRQPLTPAQALRWRGRFAFVTDLSFPDRGHIEVGGALIEPMACSVTRTKIGKDALNRPSLQDSQTLTFPACIVEKYAGFTAGDIHDTTTQTLVAVCPKAVTLAPGEIVTVGGILDKDCRPCRYRVQTPHELSEFKNEYELVREEDA